MRPRTSGENAEATSALRGVSSLVRLKPHPTMVLVCSSLDVIGFGLSQVVVTDYFF